VGGDRRQRGRVRRRPPARAASTFDLTIALIIRTVLLNAIVGVALGWLFWQRSLETAMVARRLSHRSCHGFTAGTLFF